MKAAVFRGPKRPLNIEDVEIDEPRGREMLVRTAASGICHSDIHFIDGVYGYPVPAVLGHEAAGIVERIGPEVTYVKPGDRVIACPSIFCGACVQCLTGHPNLCEDPPRRHDNEPPRLSQKGERVHQFAHIASYAEMMLLHENGVIKFNDGIPLVSAALIGCGVTTGLGAALNTAKVAPGSTVAVFGAGGVGLAAIQGARIAGARMIIAVELNEFKLATAMQFGATHVIDGSTLDPVKTIVEMTKGGVDYAFEAIGSKRAAEQTFECVRPGGTATIIGMVPVGQKLEIDPQKLHYERKLLGSRMGSNRFRFDMPKYIEMYRQGRLKLDEMITRTVKLTDINEAIESVKAGNVSRVVVTFD